VILEVELFATRTAVTGSNLYDEGVFFTPQYAVAADDRFLINVDVTENAVLPINVVLNWTAVLEPSSCPMEQGPRGVRYLQEPRHGSHEGFEIPELPRQRAVDAAPVDLQILVHQDIPKAGHGRELHRESL